MRPKSQSIKIVLLIGKNRPAGLRLIKPQHGLAAELFDLVHDPWGCKLRRFHGHTATAQLVDTLGRVRDNQEVPRGASQDLFAQ